MTRIASGAILSPRRSMVLDPRSVLNPTALVWKAIQDYCSPFFVQQFTLEHRQETVIRVIAQTRNATKEWHSDAIVSHQHLAQVSDVVQDITQKVEVAKSSLEEHLTEVLGEYPYARFWMMHHLNAVDVIGNKPIPGWCWSQFKKAHPTAKASRYTWGLVEEDEEMPLKTGKRPRTVKRPPVKPITAKKPKCPIHSVEMAFNTIRNVWECKEEGCKQIAMPKRERVEGTVLLGKGKIELRVVFPGGGESARVVLMSDDSVALDITEYANVSNLFRTSDISNKVDAAVDDGLSEFTIRNPIVEINFPHLTVMGVENA